MAITFLQGLWFVLICVLIIAYFVLDGFDLGVGVLYPFIGKSEEDRSVMKRAVGPVWDGNEVWLLTAGGALFAAFAPAYATTFSGFYLAIMLVLFGLIIRAVSLEMGAHDPQMSRLWDALFFIGSAVPALLFGVAVGNVIAGIPLDANGDYTGGFFGLLSPFALVCGLVGLAQFVALGANWLCVKTAPGGLHDRAAAVRVTAQIAVLAFFLLATALYFFTCPRAGLMVGGLMGMLRILFAIVVVACVIINVAWVCKNADLPAFFAAAVTCVGLVGLSACSIFPYIVPAADPLMGITIAGAASSELALTCMTIITCIGLPLVCIYHVLVYRTFRGKISAQDLEH